MRTDSTQKEKDRKKKQEKALELQLFKVVEKSLDAVIDKALDEIFKDFTSASGRPTAHSVAMPHRACTQAPIDQMKILHI